MVDENSYDVFLSHRTSDKPAVERIAVRLRDELGLRPFLDKWHLVPGEEWPPALEHALRRSRTVAVFFGMQEMGAWHDQEAQLSLVLGAGKHERRVIPVLLPGASKTGIDGFLSLRTWVDLAEDDGFVRLVAGITGRPPELLIDLGQGRQDVAARVQREPVKVAPTRLPASLTKLFGREEELAWLDAAWESSGADAINVATIVAWGGVGKTSLVVEWMNQLAADGYRGARAVFDWSFFSQGMREQGAVSGEAFICDALRFFGDDAMADSAASAWDKGSRLATLVGKQRALLVLDGLEPLQHPPGRGVTPGKLTDPGVEALLRGLARVNAGLCVVTTREAVEELPGGGTTVRRWDLERLTGAAGVALLEHLLESDRFKGPVVASTTAELRAICKAVDGHALTLQLLGRYLRRRRWDASRWREISFEKADGKVQGGHAFRMMRAYERWLAGDEEGAATHEGPRQLAVNALDA